jgi:hypothetical protein
MTARYAILTLTPFCFSRLTSLRLEVDRYSGVLDDQYDLLEGISLLVNLENLCCQGFDELADWPEHGAYMLRPLHRLRALVGDGWSRPAGRHIGVAPCVCIAPCSHPVTTCTESLISCCRVSNVADSARTQQKIY